MDRSKIYVNDSEEKDLTGPFFIGTLRRGISKK
jgi:hypothetical protein